MGPEAKIMYFDTPAAWRAWLVDHAASQTEIWIGLYKKDRGKTGINYEQALEEALCYGWIDGLTKRVDEDSYKMRFSPRKPRSNWSTRNVERVEILIKNGKMTPAGLAPIQGAKSAGRWPSDASASAATKA